MCTTHPKSYPADLGLKQNSHTAEYLLLVASHGLSRGARRGVPWRFPFVVLHVEESPAAPLQQLFHNGSMALHASQMQRRVPSMGLILEETVAAFSMDELQHTDLTTASSDDEWGQAILVPCIEHFTATTPLEQLGDNRITPPVCSPVERRPVVIGFLHEKVVASFRMDELHRAKLTAACSDDEWRPTVIGACIEQVCQVTASPLEQLRHNGSVVGLSSEMQRRPAIRVLLSE
mmetsp:Transcript_7302/g.17777  ORF Transcript_7302/g.17777 Transcript_7302/m.17777 type:complete len:233 (+) Transcript_7302:389-1087(+)